MQWPETLRWTRVAVDRGLRGKWLNLFDALVLHGLPMISMVMHLAAGTVQLSCPLLKTSFVNTFLLVSLRANMVVV